MFVQSDSALTVVENKEGGGGRGEGRDDDDDKEEVTVDEDEGDLEVVQPTEEWQTLKPGNVHELPVICHCQETSGLVLDVLCVCVCVCRPGSAHRCPCEAESADRSEGGQTGRGAAKILDT